MSPLPTCCSESCIIVERVSDFGKRCVTLMNFLESSNNVGNNVQLDLLPSQIHRRSKLRSLERL